LFGSSTYRLKQIDFDGKYEFSKEVEIKIDAPSKNILQQNFPNPFNPETVIRYQLSTESHVLLKVFDVLGREIATLVNEMKPAGIYNSQFSIVHSQLSTGIYFYTLLAGNYSETKKMILTK
jgi:hypothetical protein